MEKVEDAVILAGGNGTRMLPASLFMPKETMLLVDGSHQPSDLGGC